MAQETEIKLRIRDLDAFRRALKQLKGKTVFRGSGRVHEMNLIFDTAKGGLAKKAQLLRIRTETPVDNEGKNLPGPGTRAVLTFKRPMVEAGEAGVSSSKGGEKGPTVELGSWHKVLDEIETVVTDAATLATIFEGLGMRGWFRYEKYRTTYRLSARWAKGLLIEIDETPIGNFAELEGAPGKIDRAAKELGYSKTDYILKNYLTLYKEECRKRGKAPGDMLFQKPNRVHFKKKS
jgi:adenylate cyclase, class 2